MYRHATIISGKRGHKFEIRVGKYLYRHMKGGKEGEKCCYYIEFH